MTIAKLLQGRGEIVRADPDTTLAEFVELLTEHRIGAVPVMRGDEVAGIMSERDVMHALRDQGAAALSQPIGTFMTMPVVTIPADTSLLGGLSLMTQRRIRHLPVLDTGRLVGFISIGDLVKARIDHVEAEAAAMRSYIAS